MKCNQTIAGMLAIVGVGYLAGVGHSVLKSQPVSLRAIPLVLPVGTPATDPPVGVDPDGNPIENAPVAVNTAPGATDSSADSDLLNIALDIAGPTGTITLRQAKALYDEGAYFVDARKQGEYDESHIAYAMFLPAPQIRTRVGIDELSTIPPGVTIVVYCVGGECDASTNARNAIINSGLGYTDIRIMGRGFEDWQDAGLPIEHSDGTITGETPISGESP